jgi:hypothetical protein
MSIDVQTKSRGRAREAVREPAAILGRDGKPLTRKRNNTEDEYHIPDELREPGWDLQWCRRSVSGQEDVPNMVRHMENGWRPVPAERWNGRFMPDGYKGVIQRGGLELCERPMSLTEEAKREDRHNALAQRRQQMEQFGLKDLPQGFDGPDKYEGARKATIVRRSREVADASLAPKLEIDSE